MPIWLNTTGKTNLGIGQCDRCFKKQPITNLVQDGNAPGMRVCPDRCRDDFDPYRLPAPPPDDVTLPFYRPILPSLTFDPGAPPPVNGLVNNNDDWIEPTSPHGPPGGGMYGIEVTD